MKMPLFIHFLIALVFSSSQKQHADIDHLALQREHNDLKRRHQELKENFDKADEKLRGLTETYDEAVATVESLTNDLKDERQKRVELENLLKENQAQKQTQQEVPRDAACTLKHVADSPSPS